MTIRHLIVVRAADYGFIDHTKYGIGDPAERKNLFDQAAGTLGGFLGFNKFSVLDIPSLNWKVELTQKLPRKPPLPDRLVFSIELDDQETADEFRSAAQAAINSGGGTKHVYGVGADISLEESDYFCPANVDQLLFGDRNNAAALTRSAILHQQNLTGSGVNVIVIDEGFDGSKVHHFGGGLINCLGPTVHPGSTTRGHGPMMVRNIVAAAPEATFYDVPLIPLRISNVTSFIGHALSAFIQLELLIVFLGELGIPPWNGPWVIVNAWSIFDRSSEYPLGDYTQNPYHPLNIIVDQMASFGIDFVFAAGNCGQFCPDRRCGDSDIGPGSSIYGANSLARVITTGAVRTDAMWVGSSSQGPGQAQLSLQKPDLCAPSYFRENGDAFVGNLSEPFVGDTGSPYIANTGTSAACGVTAGIVAALRGRWKHPVVAPDTLRDVLNQTARKTQGPNPNGRLGNGIIDATAAFGALQQQYP